MVRTVRQYPANDAQYGVRLKNLLYEVYDRHGDTLATFDTRALAHSYIIGKVRPGADFRDKGESLNVDPSDWEHVIDVLIQKRSGHALIDYKPDGVNELMLVWGHRDEPLLGKHGSHIDGFGLAHIEDGHGIEMVLSIPDILRSGTVTEHPTDASRVVVNSGANGKLIVAKDWYGEPSPWVITAVEGKRRA
jgi:hypothetical protein